MNARALRWALGALASLPAAAAAQVVVPTDVPVPLSGRLVSLLGLVLLMVAAWAMSPHRRIIAWRVVVWGCGLQIVLGAVLLRTDFGTGFFLAVNSGIGKLLQFYREGADLIFEPLMSSTQALGRIPFAFSVLPTIIFFSSLMAVLYHLGIMQLVVGGIARVMQWTLKTSGAESLSAAGNIFVGQTEAPLLVRPYVGKMTDSELNAVMVGGFATVAGGVMVAYVGMLQARFPDVAGHIMIASIMSAPAALVIAKLMLPETGTPETSGQRTRGEPSPYQNTIDAAASGAADGLTLAFNVAAMLLAFVGLVALLNALVAVPSHLQHRAVLGDLLDLFASQGLTLPEGCLKLETISFEGSAACVEKLRAAAEAAGHASALPSADLWAVLSMQKVLGWAMAPAAWILGVPWEDSVAVGSLIGTKTVLNEFYAYLDLATMLETGVLHHPRSAVIATYALCGFANFGSIAIQVGGIGALAPHRRPDLARLGMKAMIGGTLAAMMTGAVAGLVL